MNHAELHTSSAKLVPYKPVYMLAPSAAIDVPADVVVCIKLNDDTLNEFAGTFKRVRSAQTAFMVLLNVNEKMNEAKELLIHSLFSLNYYTFGGSPVIAYADRRQHAVVCDSLQKQGFYAITSWFIGSGAAGADVGPAPMLFPPDATPAEWAEKVLLRDFDSLTNHVIIDVSSSAAAAMIDDQLRMACNSLLESYPLFSAAIENYLLVKSHQSELLKENLKIARQLKGAETTIGVIRSKYKDDYENLFAWYHREYEILPLWYKRFGHIIKVIMGKRTFRSLFSDDVKKYKN